MDLVQNFLEKIGLSSKFFRKKLLSNYLVISDIRDISFHLSVRQKRQTGQVL